tara:strand:+ start:3171 stop:3344 length:174 start_codon:yes stop_codon:yes gene_type:complete
MTIQEIKKLVEKYPNDMELGQEVRALYWTTRKQTTSNQLDLFEDEEDQRDDAVLGYD